MILLRKHWFLVGMAAMVLTAMNYSQGADILQRYRIIKAGVFLCFFMTGLTLRTAAIRNELRNIKALTAALLSGFVLLPIVALLLARLVFGANPDIITGVTILSVLPVTIASGTVLTTIAGGNVALSLLVNVSSNFLAIFTVPLSLTLLLRTTEQVQLPVGKMMLSLGLMVLLPTVLGQLLRLWVHDGALRYKKGFSIFAQIVVLLVIYNGVASAAGTIQQLGWQVAGIAAFALALHGIVLLMNAAVSRAMRLDRAARSVFLLHVSQKSLTIGYIVWAGYFAENFPLALIPTIVYHVGQLVVDGFLAQKLSKE